MPVRDTRAPVIHEAEQEADLEEKHVHGDNRLKSDQPAVGFLQNKSCCFWMRRWTQRQQQPRIWIYRNEVYI